MRNMRVEANITDLSRDYFETRMPVMDASMCMPFDPCGLVDISLPLAEGSDDTLHQFCDGLYRFTRYSTFRELSGLVYSDSNGNSSVSSIEFDKDGDYFAVAGVSKRIKV